MQLVLVIFGIAAIGYLLGSIQIKGIGLGTSMVLMVALVFGHLGFEVPGVIKDFGLVIFVGSVGLIAGPVFFQNFKQKAFAYIILGAVIIAAGVSTTWAVCSLMDTPAGLGAGIFSGALTSTPALAAAMEAAADPLIPVGYGIAYLFGVIGVVLYVQVCPKILGKDLQKEAAEFAAFLGDSSNEAKEMPRHKPSPEAAGLPVITIVLLMGLLLGKVSIALPGGIQFSLGTTGGPLFLGILAGYFLQKAPIALPDTKTLGALRELGLMLFLIGAGVDAGQGFLEVLRNYGWQLFVQGLLITLVPMIIGSFVAIKLLKLNTIAVLGAICGGMTSTPALGALISSAKTDQVTVAYAATYPIALILVVAGAQILLAIL